MFLRRSCKVFLPLLAVVGMTGPWLVIYQHGPTATRIEQHFKLESGSWSSADAPSARTAGQADGRWMALHESFVQRARAGHIKLLFLGDSLTMQWLQQPAWRDEWEPRGAVNFGIGGDRIQHAHWRLQHGEIDISPAPQACIRYATRYALAVYLLSIAIAEGLRAATRHQHQPKP